MLGFTPKKSYHAFRRLGSPFQLADLNAYVLQKHLHLVTFNDGAGTSGTFRPTSRELDVTLNRHDTRFADLPANLWGYTIRLGGNAVVTAADIDTIFKWNNVQTMQIVDENDNDVAVELSLRAGQLPHFINHLSLTVQQNSYKQLNLSTFLAMPLINTVVLEAAPSMSDYEFNEFVAMQHISDDFSANHNGRSVTYKKLNSW